MKIIVGLGNIGEKYQSTRHNIGFMVVDELAKKLETNFKKSAKLFSETAKDQDCILVKPQTYMNDSGRAVRAVCDYYQINPEENLIVIHDDLDLAIGKVKRQHGTGPKVHNGLASIYQSLRTKSFLHIRIGVDGRNGARSMPGSNYVLSNFLQDEAKIVKEVIEQVTQELIP